MSESKLLIVMSSGPSDPHRCTTPFHIAAIGAALEQEVRMFFTSDGALLLKKGVAETVFPTAGGRPVGDLVRDVMDLGVELYVCTPAMELNDLRPDDLIDGVTIAGGVALLEMAGEASVVLSF